MVVVADDDAIMDQHKPMQQQLNHRRTYHHPHLPPPLHSLQDGHVNLTQLLHYILLRSLLLLLELPPPTLPPLGVAAAASTFVPLVSR